MPTWQRPWGVVAGGTVRAGLSKTPFEPGTIEAGTRSPISDRAADGPHFQPGLVGVLLSIRIDVWKGRIARDDDRIGAGPVSIPR